MLLSMNYVEPEKTFLVTAGPRKDSPGGSSLEGRTNRSPTGE
jgi:hypothetical protein